MFLIFHCNAGIGTVSDNTSKYYSLKDQDQLLIFVANEEISNSYFVFIGVSF
jgi:hypothetical protein